MLCICISKNKNIYINFVYFVCTFTICLQCSWKPKESAGVPETRFTSHHE